MMLLIQQSQCVQHAWRCIQRSAKEKPWRMVLYHLLPSFDVCGPGPAQPCGLSCQKSMPTNPDMQAQMWLSSTSLGPLSSRSVLAAWYTVRLLVTSTSKGIVSPPPPLFSLRKPSAMCVCACAAGDAFFFTPAAGQGESAAGSVDSVP